MSGAPTVKEMIDTLDESLAVMISDIETTFNARMDRLEELLAEAGAVHAGEIESLLKRLHRGEVVMDTHRHEIEWLREQVASTLSRARRLVEIDTKAEDRY